MKIFEANKDENIPKPQVPQEIRATPRDFGLVLS